MSDEQRFQYDILYVLVDNVVAGLTERYEAISTICELFSFLWQFQTMSIHLTTNLGQWDSCINANHEIHRLSYWSLDNVSSDHPINPLKLLNDIVTANLQESFSEVIALNFFPCCLLV